ncbi:hypothetical protein LTR91_023414 [Friedmanniomyces endolithicus]|uniref:DUF7924 domain-containing protein n=1 Tax=Friedmanniomyces endolithicus TaxID=329885 RepID=A0AAN6H901_9PEZI|nr:hypothetical protein LTR57_023167 [Friedmanniomyces endolithicus]KAK0954234.1 hypothetical protein LTR91_023414 [Friedmanniomyces endolithicus]KAK0954319.1 hypothetical protein LTS01_023967 [Friedmanniomyces endolithicus]KAK1023275.1 hypothetical protein LTS16_025035 [Friedmanniomyces endolithicus]
MHPIIGDFNEQSYFMATWYMYFPFLTCEVKCGPAALGVADRQNAHSTAVAGVGDEVLSASYSRIQLHYVERQRKLDGLLITKNIYDNWMPMHFKRICLAIDQIPPGIRFLESQSELHFLEPTGMSQDMSGYGIARTSEGSPSVRAEDITTSSIGHEATATPGTSVDEDAVFEKPRKGQRGQG